MRRLFPAALLLLAASLHLQAQNHVRLDSLPTSDPRIYMVIYGDHTWEYIKNDEVVYQDSVFTECWTPDVTNPYRADVSQMPQKVTLWLVDSLSRFTCPNKTKVYSKFGYRHRRWHMGVDLPLQTGTPVYAAFDGMVRVASYHKGYGNVITLRHGNGLETTYGHLSKINVQVGDKVHSGDTIGLGGSTGRSTGPHLHFETRYKGIAFDPQWIADFETGELRNDVFILKRKYLDPNSVYVPQSDGEEDEIYEAETKEREAEAEKAAEEARKAAELAAARYHRVRAGDTLTKIAAANHTSVNAICRLNNNLTPTTTLSIGRNIRVK